jgi:hypothetical protein
VYLFTIYSHFSQNNTCEYCKRTFSTKGNLKNHQRTARYCTSDLSKQKFKCEECGTEFTSMYRKQDHSCLKNKEKQQKMEQKKKENCQSEPKEPEKEIYQLLLHLWTFKTPIIKFEFNKIF